MKEEPLLDSNDYEMKTDTSFTLSLVIMTVITVSFVILTKYV